MACWTRLRRNGVPPNSGDFAFRPLDPHMGDGDGDIDYSKFTLLELEEALAGINRQRYPKSYANLRSTYEQRTAVMVIPPPSAAETFEEASDRESGPNLWSRFWDSRAIVLIAGAACLWWAYDLLSHPDSCSSGGKLIGDLVTAICENYGHTAAAGIPLFVGFASVVLGLRSRRHGT